MTLAPSIVLIFYHNRAVIVKESNDICLCIFSVEIGCIIVLYSEYACMIVKKFKSVALLDEVSVGTKKTDRRSGLEKLLNYFSYFSIGKINDSVVFSHFKILVVDKNI